VTIHSMQNHRGILAVLVSAALLAAAVVTAAVWYDPWLPDPADANRRELICWLVTRDLEQVPEATRDELAQRLEEEFSGEIDWAATARELTEQQRRQLCANFGHLVGPWLRDKAQRYAALTPNQRGAYLDELLDRLQQWRGLDNLSPVCGEGEAGYGGLMVTARRQLDAMQEQAIAAEPGSLGEFIRALQTRWAMRELSERLEDAAGSWWSGRRTGSPAQ
jgi:hypothetical protein